MHATLVSTYPPRACGLATFARDLRGGLIAASHSADVASVVLDPADGRRRPEVAFELRQHERADYAALAACVSETGADVLAVQHEFGIYGGPEGLFVTDLMAGVRQPVVTTLHTVLPNPEPHYHRAMTRVARASDHLVVMTETAARLLREVYGVDPGCVTVVPHGTPDAEPLDRAAAQAALGLGGRTVLLTFGLLGPSKGIEFALDGLQAAVDAQPDALYVVLGATHPEIVRREGEAYREGLAAAVAARGLAEHVRFENRYVDNDDLWQWLSAADVYVSPYPGLDQICSGTLAYALAAGLPVVSTPYLHAREVLAGGAGTLVRPGDTAAMGAAMARYARSAEARAEAGAAARAFGETTRWSATGARYGEVFERVTAAPPRAARRAEPLGVHPGALPAALDFLVRQTDDTGPFQHATCGVPDRRHGWCTDDAGRVLVVAFDAARRLDVRSAERERLLGVARTCLSFVAHAQRPDGAFDNVMDYDRRFRPETATQDTVGRALWGLGAAAAWSPEASARALARTLIDRALAPDLAHPRALAYAATGLDLALEPFPGVAPWRSHLGHLATRLAEAFDRCARPGWPWVCDELTYANALVPHALLRAAARLPDHPGAPRWHALGVQMLDFVLGETVRDGHFDAVGNDGWRHRDRGAARFDQQPIEAGYTAWVATAAARDLGEPRYLEAARAAAAWFFGRNRLGVPVVDVHSGASFDGLTARGVNLNQGAESSVALVLALLAAQDWPGETPAAPARRAAGTHAPAA